jgi:rod shape determining protein RodA
LGVDEYGPRAAEFIFAVLAEEWGSLSVTLYLVNALRVGMRARDRDGILLVVGLISVFGFYVLYNSAMELGLFPITGIPLPFLSYGSSFTLANFITTGLILGVDIRRYVNR